MRAASASGSSEKGNGADGRGEADASAGTPSAKAEAESARRTTREPMEKNFNECFTEKKVALGHIYVYREIDDHTVPGIR
jgi:hypothetical protein